MHVQENHELQNAVGSPTGSVKRNLLTDNDMNDDQPILSKSGEKSKALRYHVYRSPAKNLVKQSQQNVSNRIQKGKAQIIKGRPGGQHDAIRENSMKQAVLNAQKISDLEQLSNTLSSSFGKAHQQ